MAVALPMLNAMLPSPLRASAGRSAPAAPPKRFAFIYTPNGYNQATFLPAETGTAWTLPRALEPLAPVKQDITLVTGLDRTYVGGTGVHAQCGACWLTSSPPVETLDGAFPTNITLDQVIARRIGGETLLPSLELSCNDFADNKETKYFECISWAGPGYAANTEKDPRAVFRRLFGRPEVEPARSILDLVRQEANALSRRLGRDDRDKLDEYLTSVRGAEQRLERAERVASQLRPPPFPEPAGIPEHRGEYLRLMAEMFVLGFQQDLTRVATLVVDPERWDSPRMYHGVFDKPQNHHVLTHTKGDEAKEAIAKIDRFHIEFYAHVVERMKSIREGDGTLLDSCVLAMGSGISDGDTHNYRDLQVLLAGGNLRRGHLRYDGFRPLADLWLTLAQEAGVSRERFADSTGTLRELVA